MKTDETNYFIRMLNYKGEIKPIYSNVQKYINSFSAQIRNISRDVVLEEISPKTAKKEISNLLENIKLLKKEMITNKKEVLSLLEEEIK